MAATNENVERPDLSDEEEASLDRVWDRLAEQRRRELEEGKGDRGNKRTDGAEDLAEAWTEHQGPPRRQVLRQEW